MKHGHSTRLPAKGRYSMIVDFSFIIDVRFYFLCERITGLSFMGGVSLSKIKISKEKYMIL